MSRLVDTQGYPLDEWFKCRNLYRRDLLLLCREVLGFKDVTPRLVEAHQEMLAALQHFKGGWDTTIRENLTVSNLRKDYRPMQPLWRLSNPSPQRRTLILCSREFLKSSICTIAHTIQWIINYPNIRVLFSSGTGAQVDAFVTLVVEHFRSNETFRWLYPEHCPLDKDAKRFGSSAGMVTLARTEILRDPTLSGISVGSVVASGHYDVIKHDDVVDKENVRTPDAIALVNSHLQFTGPLLQRRHGIPGWTDFIGTRYDFSDAYGKILDSEKELEPARRAYTIVFCPAWTGEWGTESAKATWEERLPISALKALEDDPLQGPEILASQYGLKPRPSSSGLIESKKQIVWTPHATVLDMLAQKMLRLHVTIDLHGMSIPTAATKNLDTDYTAVTLAGFDRTGHCTVIKIWHGRPSPLDVINYLFDLWHLYPDIVDMKCPKDMIGNTLMPFLLREQTRRQRFLPLVPVEIDNRISKRQKNKALQPWFKTGAISFDDTIDCRFHLEEEIIRWPKFHDDIIDTLRDQMENRSGDVESDTQYQPLPLGAPQTLPGTQPKFLGFGPDGAELWDLGTGTTPSDVDRITGL